MVENVCVTVSNYATEALQDTLNFYGKEGFSLVSTQMALDKYGSQVMYLFFVRHTVDPCTGYDKCKQYKPKYMTNADRIREMSDEELAKLLDYELGCPVTGDCAKMSKDCKVCWLDWLHQPAKGE